MSVSVRFGDEGESTGKKVWTGEGRCTATMRQDESRDKEGGACHSARRLTVRLAGGRIGLVSRYVVGGTGDWGIAGLRDGVLHGGGEIGSVS